MKTFIILLLQLPLLLYAQDRTHNGINEAPKQALAPLDAASIPNGEVLQGKETETSFNLHSQEQTTSCITHQPTPTRINHFSEYPTHYTIRRSDYYYNANGRSVNGAIRGLVPGIR